MGVVLVACALPVWAAGGSPLAIGILSSRTLSGTAGDFVTVEAQLTDTGAEPVSDITTYMSLVNTDTKMPVDLEDWSAEKGLFIGTVSPGQALPLKWKIQFVQSGNYSLSVVAIIAGRDTAAISTLTRFKVAQKRNLNPGHVLPVALGEPVLLVFLFLGLRFRREQRSRG